MASLLRFRGNLYAQLGSAILGAVRNDEAEPVSVQANVDSESEQAKKLDSTNTKVDEQMAKQAEALDAENTKVDEQMAKQAKKLDAENTKVDEQMAKQAEALDAENAQIAEQPKIEGTCLFDIKHQIDAAYSSLSEACISVMKTAEASKESLDKAKSLGECAALLKEAEKALRLAAIKLCEADC